MGAVNVLAQVLAVRLTLLVGVAGAIFLTSYVLGTKDMYQYLPVAVYCGAVVIPLVWLAARK